jgi:hypothetical protein
VSDNVASPMPETVRLRAKLSLPPRLPLSPPESLLPLPPLLLPLELLPELPEPPEPLLELPPSSRITVTSAGPWIRR